ncbi:hypothetical protein ACTM9K_13605 [Bariatricus sp. HCP3S3_E12]|uniref:hypothetical protein n=1 Tax=Bariatricus sp. HCP3S3_E12 TaxID=3438906 RepID=UPI003F8A7167
MMNINTDLANVPNKQMKYREATTVYKFKLPKYKRVVWFQGLLDGKNGSAALNDEQVVQSGEVQMYQKRFQTYVADRIKSLDQELHSLSSKAEKLIRELNKIMPEIPESKPAPAGASAIEQRAAIRKAVEIGQLKSERKTNKEAAINLLIDIRTAFSDKEASCYENLMEMAAATEEVLAVYCKGVLHRKPLLEQNIPVVNIEGSIKQFHDQIEWTHIVLKRIDEEVLKYYEN